MAIRTVVTRGFGNGTFNGTIPLVVTRGYAIAVVVSVDSPLIWIAPKRNFVGIAEKRSFTTVAPVRNFAAVADGRTFVTVAGKRDFVTIAPPIDNTPAS